MKILKKYVVKDEIAKRVQRKVPKKKKVWCGFHLLTNASKWKDIEGTWNNPS